MCNHEAAIWASETYGIENKNNKNKKFFSINLQSSSKNTKHKIAGKHKVGQLQNSRVDKITVMKGFKYKKKWETWNFKREFHTNIFCVFELTLKSSGKHFFWKMKNQNKQNLTQTYGIF